MKKTGKLSATGKRQLNGDGTVSWVLEEVVVSGSNKNKSSNSFSIVEGFSIWGSNRYGDLGGQKGHNSYSIEASDIPAFSNANTVSGQMSFWKSLFMLCKLGVDVELRAETIQSLNTTTMEVNNIEPVEPPKIDMQIQNYSATGIEGNNTSEIKTGKARDTSVVPQDSAKVNRINRSNYLRAKEQRNANNQELRRRLDYLKQ